MRRLCRVVAWLFLLLYLLALGLWIVGSNGFFGVEPSALSGVYLVPLGLPWNLLVDIAPEPAWPYLAAAAPLVNYAILRLVCRRTRRA